MDITRKNYYKLKKFEVALGKLLNTSIQFFSTKNF